MSDAHKDRVVMDAVFRTAMKDFNRYVEHCIVNGVAKEDAEESFWRLRRELTQESS